MSSSGAARHVLVVGSLNADLIVRAERLPRAGETIVGASFHTAAGGKGANQAVAAARMGAPVVMVGRVGADSFGQLVRQELVRAGVVARYVRVDPDAPTGTGHVTIDAEGRNAIAVASGANMQVSATDLEDSGGAWKDAALLLLQLEIPIATVALAMEKARRHGIPVLLNAAPAQMVATDLLSGAAWLVVNEIEAEQLVGSPVRTVDAGIRAARALRRGDQRVVVTLGAAGAVLASGGRSAEHVPAPVVEVVDTTAAGDAFVGALAATLLRGAAEEEAVHQAVVAGSLACTRLGAIPSLPSSSEVQRADT
jgi:ribokinase